LVSDRRDRNSYRDVSIKEYFLMGTNITIFYERLDPNGKWVDCEKDVLRRPGPREDRMTENGRVSYFIYDSIDKPFDYRSYRKFSFFSGMRNIWGIEAIAKERGLPKERSQDYHYGEDEYSTDHGASWLLVKELIDFDYDRKMVITHEDATHEITYREFLGSVYFFDLQLLRMSKVDKIVFFYDI